MLLAFCHSQLHSYTLQKHIWLAYVPNRTRTIAPHACLTFASLYHHAHPPLSQVDDVFLDTSVYNTTLNRQALELTEGDWPYTYRINGNDIQLLLSTQSALNAKLGADSNWTAELALNARGYVCVFPHSSLYPLFRAALASRLLSQSICFQESCLYQQTL